MNVDAQRRTQQALERLIEDGREVGLQAVAYLDGEMVVDAWAGTADTATGSPMEGTTLVGVFSCGKGITATVVHLLYDRGLLDYDTPIVEYWPEFGVNGKDTITLRHALTHSAGIPQLPADITPEDLQDWDRMAALVAAAKPRWEPGTRFGYHAFTYGWILGEVVRRVDGRTIQQVLEEEITRPLGVAEDVALAVSDPMSGRLATLYDDAPGDPADRPAAYRLIMPDRIGPSAAVGNLPAYQRALVPAGCTASARGLARFYAALACGGELDGVLVLTPERIAQASARAVDAVDEIFEVVIPRGLGYEVGGIGSPLSDRPGVFGHDGAGGSVGYADPEDRFAFAFTKNNIRYEPFESNAARHVAAEIRSALGLE